MVPVRVTQRAVLLELGWIPGLPLVAALWHFETEPPQPRASLPGLKAKKIRRWWRLIAATLEASRNQPVVTIGTRAGGLWKRGFEKKRFIISVPEFFAA